jgi:nucleotide sugar dehydrogenase
MFITSQYAIRSKWVGIEMKDRAEKILVIGLGEIGYNNAEYMSGIGLEVEGYDISQKAVKRALEAGIIKKEAKTFEGYDYYMICVSTHNPANMFVPYLDGLLDVAERIAVEGKPGALVTIESTIPKGTSKEVFEIIQHKLHVAHVPHRYFNLEKIEHGVRQLRVLAGCQSCCSYEALQFYKHVLDIPVYTLTSIEMAELTKVIENTHRYLEIAFAEELKMFCDNQDLNFSELREAVNTKWNENIMEARNGIGGHCLPKDTKMYYELSKHLMPSSIISAAIKSNELYEDFCKQDFIFIEPTEVITVKSQKKPNSGAT